MKKKELKLDYTPRIPNVKRQSVLWILNFQKIRVSWKWIWRRVGNEYDTKKQFWRRTGAFWVFHRLQKILLSIKTSSKQGLHNFLAQANPARPRTSRVSAQFPPYRPKNTVTEKATRLDMEGVASFSQLNFTNKGFYNFLF